MKDKIGGEIMILGEPHHGWCDFNLGEFKGNCSCLTDVPTDILDAIENYYAKSRSVAIWFDEEGSWFTFVANPYDIYIVVSRNCEQTYLIE